MREELSSGGASLWSDMEDTWQSQDIPYGTTLRKDADEVLPSIAFWVRELGCYPPPELLIAFEKMFQTYMDAAGNLTLEEVFFGPPKQRLGSYAKRRTFAANRYDIPFILAFHQAKKVLNMTSDAKAAAFAQADVEKRCGTCPDAETMLKRMRRKRMRTK